MTESNLNQERQEQGRGGRGEWSEESEEPKPKGDNIVGGEKAVSHNNSFSWQNLTRLEWPLRGARILTAKF